MFFLLSIFVFKRPITGDNLFTCWGCQKRVLREPQTPQEPPKQRQRQKVLLRGPYFKEPGNQPGVSKLRHATHLRTLYILT